MLITIIIRFYSATIVMFRASSDDMLKSSRFGISSHRKNQNNQESLSGMSDNTLAKYNIKTADVNENLAKPQFSSISRL